MWRAKDRQDVVFTDIASDFEFFQGSEQGTLRESFAPTVDAEQVGAANRRYCVQDPLALVEEPLNRDRNRFDATTTEHEIDIGPSRTEQFLEERAEGLLHLVFELHFPLSQCFDPFRTELIAHRFEFARNADQFGAFVLTMFVEPVGEDQTRDVIVGCLADLREEREFVGLGHGSTSFLRSVYRLFPAGFRAELPFVHVPEVYIYYLHGQTNLVRL